MNGKLSITAASPGINSKALDIAQPQFYDPNKGSILHSAAAL
jgi:hypothetical protein